MAEVSLHGAQFDAQRGVVYAAGAGLADFCVLWLLHALFSGNRWALGLLARPFAEQSRVLR